MKFITGLGLSLTWIYHRPGVVLGLGFSLAWVYNRLGVVVDLGLSLVWNCNWPRVVTGVNLTGKLRAWTELDPDFLGNDSHNSEVISAPFLEPGQCSVLVSTTLPRTVKRGRCRDVLQCSTMYCRKVALTCIRPSLSPAPEVPKREYLAPTLHARKQHITSRLATVLKVKRYSLGPDLASTSKSSSRCGAES